jgi:hypothetical protein
MIHYQELHADSLRVQRVLRNVAVLEAKDREERLRLMSPTQPPALGQRVLSERETASQRTADTSPIKPKPLHESQSGLADIPSQNDDSPEPWTPRVGRRRSQ